jgi:D-glycero-D-manno-heptose 1,7-bisphosphate phosphatase
MVQTSLHIPVLPAVNKEWTLFLDRDGVINVEKPMDYVRNWEEFQFNPGVLDAMRIFNQLFGRILVVTNQRGVGKGYMTEQDLLDVHDKMLQKIIKHGGRIDKIYYAPELEDDGPRRKPNPTMGLEAMQDFSDIRIEKSFMIGNTFSDMEFGRNVGAGTIFLPTTRTEPPMPHPLVDFLFPDLLAAAKGFQQAQARSAQ